MVFNLFLAYLLIGLIVAIDQDGDEYLKVIKADMIRYLSDQNPNYDKPYLFEVTANICLYTLIMVIWPLAVLDYFTGDNEE